MGLDGDTKTALRFAFAASVIEYPYGWIAVKFEKLITSSPVITENLHLLAAIVMTILGIIFLLPSSKKESGYRVTLSKSGFRKGLLIGIFNPLAIPYWIGITAYLKSQGWVDTSTTAGLHFYLSGIFLGAFLLLMVLFFLSRRIMTSFLEYEWFKKIPGLLLISLGLYSFIQFL